MLGGGGGSKVLLCSEDFKSWGTVRASSGRMVMQPTADLQVGGSIPNRLTASVMASSPGFEPPTYMSAVGCSTTQPLLVLL